MPPRKPFKDSLAKLDKRFFRATGFAFTSLIKTGAILVVGAIGIGLTVLYVNNEQAAKPSGGVEGVAETRLTSEEQFLAVSQLPEGFSQKQPVEKIDILQAKIEVGEALMRSGGKYAERATDQLLLIYGTLCKMQELEGLNAQKSYGRLSEIRQQALAEGNDPRVAAADFHRALAATSRLERLNERTDFRFATDAVLNLKGRNLVNAAQVFELYSDAIELHDNSAEQDNTAIFISILADKLLDSPVSDVSNMGLSLKDHAKYSLYYKAVDKHTYSNRESKLEFYNGLFAKIEQAPPQSPKTYKVVMRLIDRLVNETDASFASSLTKRLGKAASMVSPNVKADVDQSISNIETRIALLGTTIDLSGSKSNGSPLQLPNGKPTTLVFWKFGNETSMEHIRILGRSERFDSWNNNVLVASIAPLDEQQFTQAEDYISKLTILDNVTSLRMGTELGIDTVPYQVSLDKDGKVIRLGRSTN